MEILWQARTVSAPKELGLDTKGQLIKETCNSWNKWSIAQTLSTFCTGEIDVNWIWYRFLRWKSWWDFFRETIWSDVYNSINLTGN